MPKSTSILQKQDISLGYKKGWKTDNYIIPHPLWICILFKQTASRKLQISCEEKSSVSEPGVYKYFIGHLWIAKGIQKEIIG